MISTFNRSILIIATIILIASLVVLGLFISKTMFEEAYPPIVSDCPDYWDVSNNSDSINCINNIDINAGRGTSKCRSIPASEFNSNGNSIDEVLCTKFNWAKECGIVWDGVTNNSKACENSKFQ